MSDAALAARDFFGGTLGGMAGILAGHPLDTAKTRLQAMQRFEHAGTYKVLSDTARHEGARALYKGMSFPLYSTALCNAVVFCVQGAAERWLTSALGDRPQVTGFLGGCIAGLAQSPLVCAVDLVKTQRQVQFGEGRGPLQILRARAGAGLGFRGFFQGLGPTAVKECPSYGVYFLVYEESKRIFDQSKVPTVLATLGAGGLAGCFALGMIHPVDVVKSRIQSLPVEATAQEADVWHVVTAGLRKEGFSFMLRGFGAAMQRAFVLNAATFGGYELAVAAWDKL
ncbi:unnamed protein product [Effrenium voratum]|nr:unnamed protein product [Effrenium voratum]